MAYYYKNQPCELVPNQQFDSHWNVYVQVEGRQMIVCGTPGVNLFDSEQGFKEWEPTTTATAEVIPIGRSPIIGLPSAGESPPTDATSAGTSLNINSATFTEIRKLMPGIGRTAAKKFIENRPSGGYQDFAQLQSLNAGVQVSWGVVEPLVKF